MLQFHYQKGMYDRLHLFPHVLEIGAKKNQFIQFNSFPEEICNELRIYFINDGRFEWVVNEKKYQLFPGDVVLALPGQTIGNEKSILEIGAISWLFLDLQKTKKGDLLFGKWSNLSGPELLVVSKLLLLSQTAVLSRFLDAGRILNTIRDEIQNHALGFATRINHLIDELLIVITRQLTHQNNSSRDFPKAFMHLEESLRKDLSHQWSVEEMAAITGMGATLFNEKVKSYTGFTPIGYLINIRISEAIKLLKQPHISITDIALDTGFYSSQHFSTTFKKLTGYSPGEFRKNNISNE